MVVLADDLSRVADAVEIGHRTLAVARQSIWLGLGLSIVAMIAAAFGTIPPTVGALLQEVIDIASICQRPPCQPRLGACLPALCHAFGLRSQQSQSQRKANVIRARA